MIPGLVRRDDSVRMLAWTLPLAALIGVAAGLMVRGEAGQREAAGMLADADDRMVQSIVLALQLGVMQFVLGRVHLRAAPFHLGLPLSARDLWTARLIAAVGAVILPVLLGYAVFGACAGLGPGAASMRMGANVLALIVVLPFVYQFRFTPAHRADATHPILHWLAYGAVGVTAAALLGRYSPSPTFVVPAALATALVLGLVIRRSLPAAFELASGSVVARRARGGRLPRGLRWLERVPVVSPFGPLNRALRLHWLMSANLVSLALGMVAFVVVAFRRGEYMEAYSLVLIQVLLFWMALIGLPRVAHLPISRDRLLAQCLVPGVLLVACALGAGLLVSPEGQLTDLLASNGAAAGVAVYVLIWALLTAAVLLLLRAPAATRGGVVGRWALGIGLAGLALGGVAVTLREVVDAVVLPEHPPELIRRLGDAIPVPATVSWLGVLGLAIAAWWVMRALFARIEFHRLEKQLLKHVERFG